MNGFSEADLERAAFYRVEDVALVREALGGPPASSRRAPTCTSTPLALLLCGLGLPRLPIKVHFKH
jgi:hypothetical protein